MQFIKMNYYALTAILWASLVIAGGIYVLIRTYDMSWNVVYKYGCCLVLNLVSVWEYDDDCNSECDHCYDCQYNLFNQVCTAGIRYLV